MLCSETKKWLNHIQLEESLTTYHQEEFGQFQLFFCSFESALKEAFFLLSFLHLSFCIKDLKDYFCPSEFLSLAADSHPPRNTTEMTTMTALKGARASRRCDVARSNVQYRRRQKEPRRQQREPNHQTTKTTSRLHRTKIQSTRIILRP